jgi:hypothetical protein
MSARIFDQIVIEAQTIGATSATVTSVPVAQLDQIFIQVIALCRNSSASDVFCEHSEAFFHRQTGQNVAKVGVSVAALNRLKNLITTSVSLNANTSTNQIDVVVSGDIGKTLDWQVHVTWQKA